MTKGWCRNRPPRRLRLAVHDGLAVEALIRAVSAVEEIRTVAAV